MKPQYTQPVKMQAGKLKVVELFETVQGEGVFIGVPSVFFRTGVCNFSCPGCDTKWDAWAETPIEECAEKIKAFKSRHVVFTGGEPTIWQDGLAALARLLPEHTITIESNGSIPITNAYLQNRAFWSFSPKVGSLGHDEYFKRSVVVDNILMTRGHNQLKYVLDPLIPEHIDSVFAFHKMVSEFDNGLSAETHNLVDDDRVFFQPMDYGCEVNVYNRINPFSDADYSHALRDLTKVVMERSGSRYRVCPQLHKYLSYR